MRDEERERRARWLELAITIGASVAASAVTVSWTISEKLTRFDEKLTGHEARLESQGRMLTELNMRDGAQATQIAVNGTQYADILRRLESIERKVDLHQ